MIRVSQDQILFDSECRPKNQSPLVGTIPQQVALTVVLPSLFAVQPATAQSNAVCSADNLPSMIGGFFRLTIALGIVGLAIARQADFLTEIFTLNPKQKKGLRRHRRSAMESAVVPVVLGPLYTVAGAIMGLPLAEFVNLVPW